VPASSRSRVRTIRSFIENLPHWLRLDILQGGWAPLAARVRRKLATLGGGLRVTRGADARPGAERAVDEMFDRNRLPDAYRQLLIAHLQAFYEYQPVEYPGPVLLFWARCRPLFHSLMPTLGWEYYATGRFERVVVDCNHDNILTPPHVTVVASGLERAIREWEAPVLRTGGEAAQLESETPG
jgi:thioesterase domain-containing protein